jgi:hypothetical protein
MKYIYEDIDWDDWNEEEGINEFIFDLDNKHNKLYLSFNEFKINDRVEFIFKNKSYFATVIYNYQKVTKKTIVFEFDDCIYSHSAGGKGKPGHCWNYSNFNDIIKKTLLNRNNNYDINYLINKLNFIY